MSGARPKTHAPRRRGRAFTIAECAVCVFIVGSMMVVALNVVGAAKVGQFKRGRLARGSLLAQAMMAEVLVRAYAEPVDTPAFGPEVSEGSVTRLIYDDVDDYHQWSACPPEAKDGTVLSDLTGWRRSVWVRYVSPDNFDTVMASDSGVKRIDVEVSHDGAVVATLRAVRTRNDQQPDQ